VSPYSVSKYSAEMFCDLLYKLYGYPIVTLRLFNLYGEYDISSRIIPDSIIACLMRKELKLTSGKQTRDFNYVKDVIEGILKASDVKKAIGETINIGSGKEYSIRFLVEKIIELMGNPIKPSFGAFSYRKNEVWRMRCDNSKARRILNYKPKFSLEEGLKKTIEWYEKNIDFINQNKLI
jgi:UDP-glucose 4-epimerase